MFSFFNFGSFLNEPVNMLWVILVRMGWPIDLAKIIDRYAAIVHVLGCVIPACPRVAVNDEELCQFHSERSDERYFCFTEPWSLVPEEALVREGVDRATHLLVCHQYFLRIRIQDMENYLSKNSDKKVSEELSDLHVDRDRIGEAMAMLTWWGKHTDGYHPEPDDQSYMLRLPA
jgi:hypothetical protein